MSKKQENKKKEGDIYNLYNWFEITIPRVITTLTDKNGYTEYHNLLKEKVFPAIDKLKSNKLIDNYHFLTHAGLDLRLSIISPNKSKNVSDVKNILSTHDLPTELKKWVQGRIKAEDDILRLNTEITRLLLNHPSIHEFYPLVVHYQNNSFGMNNLDEVNFYKKQAIDWLATLYVNNGLEKEKALLKAIDDIIQKLERIKTNIKR